MKNWILAIAIYGTIAALCTGIVGSAACLLLFFGVCQSFLQPLL